MSAQVTQLPGFSLHDELSLLVKAGLPEMEALEAATRNPARAFHLTDQGTIEPGMRADLVLLTQTRSKISATRGKYGRWLRPAAYSTEKNWT